MLSPLTGNGTASENARPSSRLILLVATGLTLALALPAIAADNDKARIYRCEVDGKKVTRDRPIIECRDKVQYLLNADGSLNREIPPTLTVEEREKQEQADLARQSREAQLKQDIRGDRNLKQLYPNEAAHKKARDTALDEVRASVKSLETSIEALVVDRKKLLDEAEFYPNKPLPTKLKSSLEANEVTLKAKRDLVEKQQSEVMRITNNYDVELARLRKLWAGAPAGSLGPLPGTQQAAVAPAPAPAGLTAGTPAAVKTTVK